MTWVSLLPYALCLLAGFSGGYVFSDWLSEGDRTEAATLRADRALMSQASQYQRDLLARQAATARRSIDGLLDRLDRARSAREVRYEYRDRIIERIPRDRVCLDADDLRVLDAADRAAAPILADSLNTGPAVDRAAAAAAPDAGLSAGAAAGWITGARDHHDAAREQIGAIGGVLRELDGQCGCIRIDDGRER